MAGSFSLAQLAYNGDPVLRGLSGRPSLFSANDVAQGTDPRFAASMQSGDPSPPSMAPPQQGTPPIAPPQGSQDPGKKPTWQDPVECVKHPVDCISGSFQQGYQAGQSAGNFVGDWVNRILLGLVAIVLIGGGIWIFAKD